VSGRAPGPRSTARKLAGTLAAVLLAGAASPLAAQDGRGSLRSITRYVELRPLRQDTVPRDQVTALPDGAFRFEGLAASCDAVRCVVLRAGPVQYGVLATLDASYTAWGYGVQGLSATVLARGRTQLGGQFHAPQSDEPFEAILGYAELARGAYRLRAGRQRELSGLGFSGFDGVDVLYEPSRRWRAQLYGGRGLARGVQQSYTRAFRGVDEADFVRGRNAVLLGGEVGMETADGSTAALHWQAKLWSDRAGYLSDRAQLVARTPALSPIELSGAAEYDIGLGRLGSAHAAARYPVPGLPLMLEATARRHLPFFEYWTIWGMFSPVAWHEAEMRAAWQPRAHLGVWGSGAVRRYDDHDTQTFRRPLEARSLRAALGGGWRARPDLGFDAGVRMEGPVGAFTFSGDAALDWRAGERVDVRLQGVVLEQVEEFRLGAGVLAGGLIAADVRLRNDLRAGAGFELYRQAQPGRPGGVDWTQRRAWLSVAFDIGQDPGLRREGAR
jgi:hypothetical protein